nr:RNA-directed DNA polymerase, eukaryota, reverse transcriptase zinc-binding domain protein [Tanacetum cinerariifolium]
MLSVMEEIVKVGQAMGYNMEGCVNNITEIIESQGASGLEADGFDKFVIDSWNEALEDDNNAIHKFLCKLKFLKSNIRRWYNVYMNNKKGVVVKLREDLRFFDEEIDKGNGSVEIVNKRLEVRNKLQHMVNAQASKVAQKVKIKWYMDGDENVKFFHDLERMVSKEEVKKAVWDCGIDKSPGQDGFTFGFYRHFWSTIECDVFETVKHFSRKVQSAFIKERQILDGPFILNEVMRWCRMKKKQALIFNADFEKAYDSVRWDLLDDVLYKFGFGDKWCVWIQSCLKSSRGSILINGGSSTEEFQFFRGLKQGDPLSPFLFILIMESLHLSFQHVVDSGLSTRISLNSMAKLKSVFEGIFYGLRWSIWNFRNKLLFEKDAPSQEVIFDNIVSMSFNWSNACYGYDSSQFPSKNLFAAAGDRIWDNGAACG